VLQCLDPARAPHPDGDGRTALVTEVECEEERSTRRRSGVQARRNVLHPVSAIEVCDEGRGADEKEGEAIDKEGDGEEVQETHVACETAPDDGEGEVNAGDGVEFVCGLANLTGEKRDLVGVGGDDLTKGEAEGVDGPGADLDLEVSGAWLEGGNGVWVGVYLLAQAGGWHIVLTEVKTVAIFLVGHDSVVFAVRAAAVFTTL
jgi:hypothetical protein